MMWFLICSVLLLKLKKCANFGFVEHKNCIYLTSSIKVRKNLTTK